MTVQTWDGLVAAWPGTRRDGLLRAYSDEVNTALLRRWLPPVGGRRVLKTDLFDEAVGRGLFPTLGALDATVVGVDVSPATAGSARARYAALRATAADVRRLSYADASFDVVVSNSTLDHFESVADIETALGEIRRVLVPGGVLLVTLDNPRHPLVALRNALPAGPLRRLRLVPYEVGATCDHRRLASLLERAGFAVTHRHAVMHVPRVVAALPAFAFGRWGPLDRWFLRLLRAAEGCARLPSRYVTGQFIAVRAVRV